MNIEDDALTPEERALERELAQRLARLGPQREPSPALDARILAAAHAAARPRAPVRRRRAATWPAALGVAASVVFALGVVWKLHPRPEPVVASEAAGTAEEPLADYAPAPPPAGVYAPRPKRVLEVPAPPPAERPVRSRAAGVAKPRPAPRPAPAQEPPYAFEAAPAPVAAPPAAPAMAPQAGLAAPPPPAGNTAVTAQSAADAAQARREAADASAMRDEVRPQAARKAAAAAAEAADEVEFAEPDEEVVPPATADSPQVREAWLQRIRELAKAGRFDEARASLREFRHRYPGDVLPDDLRALDE
jgi:hypothetical protein